jgi:hypothetical protein
VSLSSENSQLEFEHDAHLDRFGSDNSWVRKLLVPILDKLMAIDKAHNISHASRAVRGSVRRSSMSDELTLLPSKIQGIWFLSTMSLL